VTANTKKIILTYLLIIFIAALPVILVVLADFIASINGCRLDEGSVHPCKIIGVNIGGLLTGMFVCGWLALASLPFGFIALIVYTLIIIFRRR
jgi:hypothetical protein